MFQSPHIMWIAVDSYVYNKKLPHNLADLLIFTQNKTEWSGFPLFTRQTAADSCGFPVLGPASTADSTAPQRQLRIPLGAFQNYKVYNNQIAADSGPGLRSDAPLPHGLAIVRGVRGVRHTSCCIENSTGIGIRRNPRLLVAASVAICSNAHLLRMRVYAFQPALSTFLRLCNRTPPELYVSITHAVLPH